MEQEISTLQIRPAPLQKIFSYAEDVLHTVSPSCLSESEKSIEIYQCLDLT